MEDWNNGMMGLIEGKPRDPGIMEWWNIGILGKKKTTFSRGVDFTHPSIIP